MLSEAEQLEEDLRCEVMVLREECKTLQQQIQLNGNWEPSVRELVVNYGKIEKFANENFEENKSLKRKL